MPPKLMQVVNSLKWKAGPCGFSGSRYLTGPRLSFCPIYIRWTSVKMFIFHWGRRRTRTHPEHTHERTRRTHGNLELCENPTKNENKKVEHPPLFLFLFYFVEKKKSPSRIKYHTWIIYHRASNRLKKVIVLLTTISHSWYQNAARYNPFFAYVNFQISIMHVYKVYLYVFSLKISIITIF